MSWRASPTRVERDARSGRLGTAMDSGSEPQALPYVASYVLHRGGRAIARLEWRASPRQPAGWYLRRARQPARRLAVDAALEELADDTRSDHPSWRERARLAATLSTPLALDAADRALRGGLPPAPSRPLGPGVYELHVTGLDPVTLAVCCPSLSVVAAGDTSVLGGVLNNDAIRTVIRRLNLLGARVLAIFSGHAARPPLA